MSVQVWDGKKFTNVDQIDADLLVAAGTHEISTGKNANDLRRKFTPSATYKTREMRAENGTVPTAKKPVSKRKSKSPGKHK